MHRRGEEKSSIANRFRCGQAVILAIVTGGLGVAALEHTPLMAQLRDLDLACEREISVLGDLHYQRGGKRLRIVKTGDRTFFAQVSGSVRLINGARAVDSMSPEARLVVKEQVRGTPERCVQIVPVPGGKPHRAFFQDRTLRPFDEAADRWLQAVLREAARELELGSGAEAPQPLCAPADVDLGGADPFGPSGTVSGSAGDSLPPLVRAGMGAQIDEYLRRAVPFGLAGAILVARGDTVILHQGYGMADRERGLPVTTETVFDAVSVTKQFTAAAILRLGEQGKLALTDSLGHFFPEVPPDKAGITVHYLLTHSAGLRNIVAGDYTPISRDSLVQAVLAAPASWKPGARSGYSNSCY